MSCFPWLLNKQKVTQQQTQLEMTTYDRLWRMHSPRWIARSQCQKCEIDTRREWTAHLVGERDQRFGLKEWGTLSAFLKKCRPITTAVASITSHDCYGLILKHDSTSTLIPDGEIIKLPESAGKPEIGWNTNGGWGHSKMRRWRQNDSEGNGSI